MADFQDRVALVTGAGGGIGREVALQLAGGGAQVIVADVSDAGQQTASDIESAGGRALFVATDVRDSEQVAAMVASAVTHFGSLDIAVNNAGIDPEVTPEASWEEAILDQVLAINLKGVFLCMKEEIAHMLTRGGGRIVNLASAAGITGVANKPAYSASKHGVVGLTRAAALQYAARGIRINAVCPGAVDTRMLDNNLGAGVDKAMVGQNHPIQRLATPAEIAAAVLWLCGDSASYMAGHALVVDGGLTVQ